jgi:hypothetical protein
MLRTLPIRDLRGVNRNIDSTDKSNAFFSSIENLVPWPEGSLSSLVWTGSTGDSSSIVQIACKADIDTALSGESASHAHLVRIDLTANSRYDLLCVWSKQEAKPLMLMPIYKEWEDVSGSTEGNFRCPGALAGGNPESVTLLYSDLSPTLPCYGSRIADFIVIGNGTDANVKYSISAGTAAEWAVSSPDFKDPAKVSFPPCKHFVMGANREIYGAGNVTNPLNVYASQKPGVSVPLVEGIQSLDTSFTKIVLPGATKINGLSLWNNYISAHTDGGVVNLFGHNSASDSSGYKTDQRPSNADAGATSPESIESALGQGAYYFGEDNQLYYDQAIRGGPFNTYGDARTDTPLAQFGYCLQHMAPYADGDYRSVIYDSERGLVYIVAKLDKTGWGNAIWCYNERSKAVTGPLTGVVPERVTAVKLGPARVTTLLAMTGDGDIHVTCGPQEASRPRNPADTAIEWDEDTLTIPVSSKKRTMALQAAGDTNSTFAALELTEDTQRTVFGDESESTFNATKALRDFSQWAMLDTGMIDMGEADREKTLREVRVSLAQGHDYGVVGVVLNDEGHYRYKETFPGNGRTQPVLRFNIRGRRLRILVFVGVDLYTPLTIKDMTYGLLVSRSLAKG